MQIKRGGQLRCEWFCEKLRNGLSGILKIDLKNLKKNLVCWYVPRLAGDQNCLLMFAVVGLSRINKAKQNIIFVRKGLWICLPPYFSVRDQFPDFFYKRKAVSPRGETAVRFRIVAISCGKKILPHLQSQTGS
ncbi:MAG TPA: hypothetical protein PLK28_01470 [Candidatus Rifleibacterium sp.]|jgi:hypothetical protein|nr:hypothetical protein [Candidatus Rifleibacterium sp.]